MTAVVIYCTAAVLFVHGRENEILPRLLKLATTILSNYYVYQDISINS